LRRRARPAVRALSRPPAPFPHRRPPARRQLLNVTFGFRGTRNAASWAVAGGIAYYFIWLPEQRRRADIEVGAGGGVGVRLWVAGGPGVGRGVSPGCRRWHRLLLQLDAGAAAPWWLPVTTPSPHAPPPRPAPRAAPPSPQRDRLLAKERAVAAGLVEIDRARPMPDPQDRGLLKGAAAAAAASGGGGEAAKGGA
jgi:hypothetical protein